MPGFPIPSNETRAGTRVRIRKLLIQGAVLAAMSFLGGCAFVPQRNREFLSDPIMQRQEDALESALEGHDFPRREGSVGGSSGSGGGCGC
jgi:hypothetical protein